MSEKYHIQARPIRLKKPLTRKRAARNVNNWWFKNQPKILLTLIALVLVSGLAMFIVSRGSNLVMAFGLNRSGGSLATAHLDTKALSGGPMGFDLLGVKSDDTISGTVSISAMPKNVSKPVFEYYLDDNFINSTDEAPYCAGGNEAGKCQGWDTTQYESGSHHFKVIMRGTTVLAQDFKIVISNRGSLPGGDNIDPSLTLAAPEDNFKMTDNTLHVVATARDNHRVLKIEAYLDGKLIGSQKTAVFTLDWSGRISDGSHNLTVKAFDEAGNSDSKSVTILK